MVWTTRQLWWMSMHISLFSTTWSDTKNMASAYVLRHNSCLQFHARRDTQDQETQNHVHEMRHMEDKLILRCQVAIRKQEVDRMIRGEEDRQGVGSSWSWRPTCGHSVIEMMSHEQWWTFLKIYGMVTKFLNNIKPLLNVNFKLHRLDVSWNSRQLSLKKCKLSITKITL